MLQPQGGNHAAKNALWDASTCSAPYSHLTVISTTGTQAPDENFGTLLTKAAAKVEDLNP